MISVKELALPGIVKYLVIFQVFEEEFIGANI